MGPSNRRSRSGKASRSARGHDEALLVATGRGGASELPSRQRQGRSLRGSMPARQPPEELERRSASLKFGRLAGGCRLSSPPAWSLGWYDARRAHDQGTQPCPEPTRPAGCASSSGRARRCRALRHRRYARAPPRCRVPRRRGRERSHRPTRAHRGADSVRLYAASARAQTSGSQSKCVGGDRRVSGESWCEGRDSEWARSPLGTGRHGEGDDPPTT